MIKAIFVDDRLLHGKIALHWASYYRLTDIIVANDETSNDEFTKMILDLAKPKNVKLHFIEVDDLDSIIEELNQKDRNTIVIVSNLFDARKILDVSEYSLKINITGLRERLNCYTVNERVALSPEDISIIRKLIKNNVLIQLQVTPDEEMIQIDEEFLSEAETSITK